MLEQIFITCRFTLELSGKINIQTTILLCFLLYNFLIFPTLSFLPLGINQEAEWGNIFSKNDVFGYSTKWRLLFKNVTWCGFDPICTQLWWSSWVVPASIYSRNAEKLLVENGFVNLCYLPAISSPGKKKKKTWSRKRCYQSPLVSYCELVRHGSGQHVVRTALPDVSSVRSGYGYEEDWTSGYCLVPSTCIVKDILSV